MSKPLDLNDDETEDQMIDEESLEDSSLEAELGGMGGGEEPPESPLKRLLDGKKLFLAGAVVVAALAGAYLMPRSAPVSAPDEQTAGMEAEGNAAPVAPVPETPVDSLAGGAPPEGIPPAPMENGELPSSAEGTDITAHGHEEPAPVDNAPVSADADAPHEQLPVVTDEVPPSSSQLENAPGAAPTMPASDQQVAAAEPSSLPGMPADEGAPSDMMAPGPSANAVPVPDVQAEASPEAKMDEASPVADSVPENPEQTAKIQELEKKVADLEATIRQLQQDAVKEPVEKETASRKTAAPAARAAKRPRHVSHIKAPVWVLKGAKPGKAWVEEKGVEGSLRAVGVGDSLPGLGMVTAVVRDAEGRWSVAASKGRISQ